MPPQTHRPDPKTAKTRKTLKSHQHPHTSRLSTKSRENRPPPKSTPASFEGIRGRAFEGTHPFQLRLGGDGVGARGRGDTPLSPQEPGGGTGRGHTTFRNSREQSVTGSRGGGDTPLRIQICFSRRNSCPSTLHPPLATANWHTVCSPVNKLKHLPMWQKTSAAGRLPHLAQAPINPKNSSARMP